MRKVFLLGVLILVSVANLSAEEEEFCWGSRESLLRLCADPYGEPGHVALAMVRRVADRLEELSEYPVPGSVNDEELKTFRNLSKVFLKVVNKGQESSDLSRSFQNQVSVVFRELSAFNNVLQQYRKNASTSEIATDIMNLQSRYEIFSK